MYFVYLLECKDGSIYTGITTDVARRLREHQARKGGSYTSSHGARRMLYKEGHVTRGDALRREAEIKKWPRDRKLALGARKTRPL